MLQSNFQKRLVRIGTIVVGSAATLAILAGNASASGITTKPNTTEFVGGYSAGLSANSEHPTPQLDSAEGFVSVTTVKCVGNKTSPTYFGEETTTRQSAGWGAKCTNGTPSYFASWSGPDGVKKSMTTKDYFAIKPGYKLWYQIRKIAPDTAVDHRLLAYEKKNGKWVGVWYNNEKSGGLLGDTVNVGVSRDLKGGGYLPNFGKVTFTETTINEHDKSKIGRATDDLCVTSNLSAGGASFNVKPQTGHINPDAHPHLERLV